jgi:hypothetical protein
MKIIYFLSQVMPGNQLGLSSSMPFIHACIHYLFSPRIIFHRCIKHNNNKIKNIGNQVLFSADHPLQQHNLPH